MVYAPDESPSQLQQDPPNSMVFYGSAVAIVVFSAVSSLAGVSKGTHRLSEFDMLLALLFLVFTGKSLFLLNALVLFTFTLILSDPNHNAPTCKLIPWAAISSVLTRNIFAQPAFNSSHGEERSPGKEVQSDEEYR